jgi:hypothetical protein
MILSYSKRTPQQNETIVPYSDFVLWTPAQFFCQAQLVDVDMLWHGYRRGSPFRDLESRCEMSQLLWWSNRQERKRNKQEHVRVFLVVPTTGAYDLTSTFLVLLLRECYNAQESLCICECEQWLKSLFRQITMLFYRIKDTSYITRLTGGSRTQMSLLSLDVFSFAVWLLNLTVAKNKIQLPTTK